MKFRVGDSVELIADNEIYGNGDVSIGDIGIITGVLSDRVKVNFPNYTDWTSPFNILRVVKIKRALRRTAKVLQPTTERERIAVRVVEKAVNGDFKATAVKIEMEGDMSRENHCDCDGDIHDGCTRFNNTKVANDFILKYLSQYGLARKKSGTPWSNLYVPVKPLIFSKVYADSETEWTVTLSLKNPKDVLYVPKLVDAFNALIAANGNGVDIHRSGMHTAFLQDKECFYPMDKVSDRQNKMFNNFRKSMTPLLPALYFLGVNYTKDGKVVTRSSYYRQPIISNTHKYSAVAYRYGALEFRVFDTCYQHPDQALDNVVTMANSVNKYWHMKYVKPSVIVPSKDVLFCGDVVQNEYYNTLDSLYVVKEHIVMLNSGLRCIKPQYYTVTDLKKQRQFGLTIRSLRKSIATIDTREYQRYLVNAERTKRVNTLYRAIDVFSALPPQVLSEDIDRSFFTSITKAEKAIDKDTKIDSMDMFVMRKLVPGGYNIGEC